MHGFIDHRCRRISTHSTGVGPEITVAHGLVILRCGEWKYIFSIGHDNETGFFADQKFFDNHPVAGSAKSVSRQHVQYGCFSFAL